jgi:RND superfamily putative drug exporter
VRALGEFTVRRRRWILVGTLLLAVAAGAFGGKVAEHLSSGGFDDPNSESSLAAGLIANKFGGGTPNIVLLVKARSGSVDAKAVARDGRAITHRLSREPGVDNVASYWSFGGLRPLRSKDGREALVVGRIEGGDDQVRTRVEHLAERYALSDRLVTVSVGGRAEVFRQVGTQVETDLKKAEMISIPVTMVLLLLVFGGAIAAGLPLAVGGLAIVGTFVVLQLLSGITTVSIFSLNLATGMGLGLGIDYSLFMVSRFREELRAGHAPDEAVVRTVETAGRTVLFSALTVSASIAALLVFPLAFLRSFAYAGAGVVTVAALGALVFLPALLAVLGPRVDKWVLFRRKTKPVGEGFWHRLATVVMRRPIPIATAIILLLLLLGSPFLRVNFGLPDDRVLPKSASSRQITDEVRTNFSSEEIAPLSVVAPWIRQQRKPLVAAYAARLSRVPGVSRVDALTGTYVHGRRVVAPNLTALRFDAPASPWFSVVPSVEPYSKAGERLVGRIRETPAPFDVWVGGASAQLVDSKAALFAKMPLALSLIGIVTLVVLFLMTGSVLIPIKAVVLNLLSLTATFGAMVWIFQEGHLSGLLGFTPTGFLDTTTPITMFCIAFGLSMDYEVFLLSRIKEEYDRTGDNTASVAIGLERTGRLVTAAAGLLAVVFIAFSTSAVTFIKLFGVGLALAVLMDATLIRGLLVPAFMRLAGRANWWAPRWLHRVHDRIGVLEGPSHPVDGGTRGRRVPELTA